MRSHRTLAKFPFLLRNLTVKYLMCTRRWANGESLQIKGDRTADFPSSFFCLLGNNHSLPSNTLSICLEQEVSVYHSRQIAYFREHWSMNRIGSRHLSPGLIFFSLLLEVHSSRNMRDAIIHTKCIMSKGVRRIIKSNGYVCFGRTLQQKADICQCTCSICHYTILTRLLHFPSDWIFICLLYIQYIFLSLHLVVITI